MKIIFLHGFPDNPEVWSHCVSHLQGRAICRTPELHSLTFEKQMDVLKEMTEEGPVVMVGHDIGGSLATEFASRFPEKVSRVVLINSIGLAMFAHRLRMLEQLIRSSYMSVFLNPFVNKTLLKSIAKILLKTVYDLGGLPKDDRLRKNSPDVLDGLSRFKEIAWRIPKRMFEPGEALMMPVDVVLCDKDHLHTKPTNQELSRFFRDPKLHSFSAGHWPMRTNPEGFNALMDQIIFTSR